MAKILNQFDSGTITFKDGTAVTPLSCTVLFDQGDFSISGLSNELADVSAYQSRRTLHSLRKGARTFPTGSFSAMMSEFSEADDGNVVDLITGKAATPFSARISTTAAKGDVLTLDLVFVLDGETSTLEDCHVMFDFAEGDPTTFSFSYTCYGAITGALAIAAAA